MAKTTYVRTIMQLETKNPDELRRILDHHADYLIDMDSNRDLISSISQVTSYETDSNDAKAKLKLLLPVLSDIRNSMAACQATDGETAKLYDEISTLYQHVTALV